MTKKSLLSVMLTAGLASSAIAAGPISGQPLMPPDADPTSFVWSDGVSTSRFPAGVADVFGNGPYDAFVSLEYIYPFEGFHASGAPIYGDPVATTNGAGNGRIVLGSDDKIYGLFWSVKTVTIREFDKSTLTFGTDVSRTLSLPANIHRATGILRPDGKLLVATTVADGEGYMPPSPPDADEPGYYPYDGSRRWRGGTPGYKLYTQLFASPSLGYPAQDGPAYGGEKVFLYENTSLSFLEPPTPSNEAILVGTDKGGIIRLFEIAADGSISEQRSILPDSHGIGMIHNCVYPNATGMPAADGQWSNMLVGDTGLLWYYPYAGSTTSSGFPMYEPAIPVRRRNVEHRLGDLPVISAGDIDGDGLQDILGGNDAGRVFWMKNVGTESVPEFATPEYLTAGGAEFVMRPGPVKSLQGPTESAWGYTCPSLYDMNKDGKLDIILSSSLGLVHVLLQTQSDPVAFGKPQAVYSDGQPMGITWRQQVAGTNWGIEGNDQLVTFDERDFLRVFHRLDATNVVPGEVLRLADGEPITANTKFCGQYGRTKTNVVDWDGDGVYDLLFGVRRWHSIPNPVTGLPQAAGGTRQSGALFMKNVGSNASPAFDFPVRLQYDGSLIELGAHSASVAPLDMGVGGKALLIAEETGSVMFYSRSDLSP
ncbi:VCBS repeat-containing protein [bacterium]|nr:VCBS repeat-containing protein [bacterium]